MKNRLCSFFPIVFLISMQCFSTVATSQELDLDDLELEDEAEEESEEDLELDIEDEGPLRDEEKDVWVEPKRRKSRGKDQRESGRSYRFYLGLGYHLAPKTDLGEIEAESGEIDVEFAQALIHDGAPEVTIGLISARENAFGFRAGLTYQMARKIKELEVISNGETQTGEITGDRPTLQFSLAELGAVYRWRSLYVTACANYSLVKYRAPEGSSAGEDFLTGSVGFSAGFGYWISNRIGIELQYKQLGLKVKFAEDNEDFTITPGNGFAAGGEAVLIFAF